MKLLKYGYNYLRGDYMLELIKELGMKETSQGRNRRIVLAKCTLCGKELEMRKDTFKVSKSCGCIRKITAPQNSRSKTHGLSKTVIYSRWNGIKERCYNPNNDRYHRYGGRGIVMCNQWKDDFLSFYNWCVENNFNENLQIDRIDNDGNYEPENCKLSTIKQQCRNRSTNVIVEYNGEKMTITEAAEKSGIDHKTLFIRYKRGDKGHDLFRDNNKRVRGRGEGNHKAKITEDEAIKIKILLSKGIKQIEIAKMFGVSKYLISDIKRGKTWSHIKIDNTEVNE